MQTMQEKSDILAVEWQHSADWWPAV